MSQSQNHLNHATWECKYHVVFTPKYRKKVLFGQLRRHLGTVFHDLARRKECKIEEGHLMPDHAHILISIPPKYSMAEVIGEASTVPPKGWPIVVTPPSGTTAQNVRYRDHFKGEEFGGC